MNTQQPLPVNKPLRKVSRQHVQGRRGCLGRAVLWEPANKPSTAVLACQTLGWLPHTDQSSCGAPREGEWPAGLCCCKSLWLSSLCGLPHHYTGSVLLLRGFFFSSSSAEKLDLNKSWLTFSRASFSQGRVAAAAVLQSEGTTGGDGCTLSTPASHLWDLITPHIGARPLLFINHIINV